MPTSVDSGTNTNPKRKRGRFFVRAIPRLLRVGLVYIALWFGGALSVHAQGPHWIGGASVVAETWRVEKSFLADAAVQSAVLKVAADFCAVGVEINGQKPLVVEPYCPTQELDVTRFVRRGTNDVAITASIAPGPAAVAAAP